MIIDFTVSNFRSIKEPQTISFEATDDKHLEDYYVVEKGGYRLLKMATIMGANASGKTNLLRAYTAFPILATLACENKTDKIPYNRFALGESTSNEDSTMTANFLCGNRKYRYSVVFNNDMVVSEDLDCIPFGEKEEHKVFQRTTDKTSLVSYIKYGEKYAEDEPELQKLVTNLLHNRTVFGAYLKSNVNIRWMKEIVDWVVSYCMPIITPSIQNLKSFTSNQIFLNQITKEQVATFLRKADIGIVDFSIKNEDIPVSQQVAALLLNEQTTPAGVKEQLRSTSTITDTKIKMYHSGEKGTVELDFNEESLGTQRYYELAGILLALTNGSHIIAIDELESSIHPDLYEHFIVSFLSNAKDSQLIYTTHMREFLSDKNLFRDDSIWFAQKDEHGATEVYSITDFDSEELQKIDSRYGAYRAGRLGGVPHLGDTYVEPLNGDKR